MILNSNSIKGLFFAPAMECDLNFRSDNENMTMIKIADEFCFIDGSPMSDKQNEMGSKVQALLHISE